MLNKEPDNKNDYVEENSDILHVTNTFREDSEKNKVRMRR